MDLKYSKKQLAPLIRKYGIDVETDKVFQAIILLFNAQTEYQIWAIKLVYDHVAPLDMVQNIKQWASDNQTSIHNLTKGNIVSYKTKEDIKTLWNEIEEIDKFNTMMHVINKFNTAQRNDIKEELKTDSPLFEICKNATFKQWSNVLTKFAKLPNNRQMAVINTSSAIHGDTSFLFQHIADSLTKAYKWEKEDMLAYMAINCPDCFEVYNEGNIVIIRVESFDSSKKMCGNGRTQWCLTREKNYYDRYVSEKDGRYQYFLFNFNLREDDDFAHIGFTVSSTYGITNAHSTRNNNLMNKVKYKDNNSYSVHDIFDKLQIPQKVYLKLRDVTAYKWNMESLLTQGLKKAKENQDYNILWSDDNQVIIKCNNTYLIQGLTQHTFLTDKITVNASTSGLVYFNFNVDKDDNMSVLLIQCSKDKWGLISPSKIYDAYGKILPQDILATQKNIKIEDIISNTKLEPEILLHKYIEENNESAALRLLEDNARSLNVNFQFGAMYPIFSAVDAHMSKLFIKLFNHPKFDSHVQHFFDVNILEYLVLMYKFDLMEEKMRNKQDTRLIEDMIREVLKSETYDFNMINTTYDSILNVCCERADCNWIIKELLTKKQVNPNIVNDIDLTALGQALSNKNYQAVELLIARPDVVVRDSDYKMANEQGYDLKSVVSRIRSSKEFSVSVEEAKAENKDKDVMATYKDVFSKILSV